MITNTSLKRHYFDSFDAFRFFAFLLVFLAHLPKSNYPFVGLFMQSGGVGVSFFFVLSGFLISYILMVEKVNTGRISLKSFFVRRILRIWPLYYAMVLFAFSTPYILEVLQLPSSDDGYAPNWLISICFLENYKMMMTDSFPNGAPLRVMWSICVEEHFYILWGLLFYFIDLKRIPLVIGLSILVANISRVVYTCLGIEFLDLFSNLDYFAFGAIAAYLFVFRRELLNRLAQKGLLNNDTIPISTVLVVLIFSNMGGQIWELLLPTLYAIIFTLLICCTLIEKGIRLKKANLFSRLGIYTYGLYLFHTIVILLLLRLTDSCDIDMSWLIFTTIAFLITLAISYLSYRFYEKPFLRLKRYFYS